VRSGGLGNAKTSVKCLTLPMGPRPSGGFVQNVNVYLLPGPPVTLVDAGMPLPECIEYLALGLELEGFRLTDVEQVVITHTHPDHYGGAGAIVEARKAVGKSTRILAHPRAVPILADLGAWWAKLHEFRLTMLRQAGAPEAVIVEASGGGSVPSWMRSAPSSTASIAVGGPLADGEVLEIGGARWEVIYTPGHASTQLCLFGHGEGILLSSDHLLPAVGTNMVLEPSLPGETQEPAVESFLCSLRRVDALGASEVWPGHGEVHDEAAGYGVNALIDHRIERCEHRLRETQVAVASGHGTAWDASLALYSGTAVGGTQRGVMQTVAYLDALVAQGRLAVDAERVPHVYRVPHSR
jgi:glyoxylase-like metal-dependent hydrolase (beta-lactamase superfamily II)